MSGLDAGAITFSTSWHRVAQVRLALRPNVRAHRQEYRGESWYVLQDPFNNQFFRISRDAYLFLCHLDQKKSVEEAWQAMLAVDEHAALSQEEVVQLLGQLNMSNLLHFDSPSVANSLFQRYKRRREQEVRAKLMGFFLSIRIPLLDPDPWLQRMLPLLRLIYAPVGAVLWSLLIFLGIKLAMDHQGALFDQAAGMLAPGNLLLLYIGFFIAKLIHELSHAAACKHFGGEVHEMGVMLVVFTPMPYVDATASWGFTSRWQRVLVGAAGMLAEFAVGAVAILIWANTSPGAINGVAYNVMFVATVSTLLFNINPLLRFDGYYILCDWLGIPNLYQRSREQLRILAERHLFGIHSLRPPVHAPLEGWIMATYGLLSLLYWLLVISGILIFVSQQYLDVGVLVALVLFFSSILMPFFKLIHYLWFTPRLEYHRIRAVSVTVLLTACMIAWLTLVPLPDRIRAPGVVEALSFRELNSQSGGMLVELLTHPGQAVTRGQPLLRLEAPDLLADITSTRMQQVQLKAQLRRAESEMLADMEPLREQLQVVETALADLSRRETQLVVTAPVDGLWSSTEIEGMVGKWLPRGSSLGMIVAPDAFRFVAVLPQVDTYLFGRTLGGAQVKLAGQENISLDTQQIQVVPFQHGALPSAALGWMGGGEVAVDPSDPHGLLAAEPFFLIRAQLIREDGVRLVHGRSGTLRLELGDTPLLWQWERVVRQFFQQNYRL
ncbi:MAG: hypothetical protein G8345_10920 [Magnetococcales bacterium]|nr:hypothetical protein [Magnetococcales bacterium]NGZ27384.1 hypothetical protein [Magnetococcales bacterium]